MGAWHNGSRGATAAGDTAACPPHTPGTPGALGPDRPLAARPPVLPRIPARLLIPGPLLLVSALLVAPALCGCQAPVLRAHRVDAVAAEEATLKGDWPRAAELWHAVYLAQRGSEVRAYYETALALLHTGDRDSACAMLDQGLLVFPSHPDLLELRARVLAESGFRRAAEESLAKVVAEQPERISALNALVRIRMQLGLEQAALEPLHKLIELTGGNAELYRLLADALRQTNRPVEAFAAHRLAIEQGAEGHSLLLQGAQLAVQESVRAAEPDALALAERWLDRVVAEDPQRTQAHFVRALLCEELGQPEQAIAHYRRAIELDLTSLEALTNLALLYAERGEVEPTREMVDRALELEERPGRRAALKALIARSLERAGTWQDPGPPASKGLTRGED